MDFQRCISMSEEKFLGMWMGNPVYVRIEFAREDYPDYIKETQLNELLEWLEYRLTKDTYKQVFTTDAS